ncbi:LytR/AlgR family response regulator transcription factor [Dyella flava]|uniref:LytTR family transcriptional regulator DNA-binding domain-containing protein n=1 Tax=Dyella flava TaxID=1920170 RepID=A0ABS2K3R0_9GAMM|nr:response regulator [Dyella flava]MBM7124958.1 LytTR family transcriptional regulator DNA-binding domain-containing protein [Dyella flava]GLQ49912.1 DNA-binding response regulator [Dyella flava]
MLERSDERIRVLVVDDEAPARQRLIDLLREDAQIASIGEASNGVAAVTAIESDPPDLVFLDVQMPELDGLGVVEAIGAAQMPLTVFVTAYDQHALRAFESNAMDYLLKPFSDERLHATLERAKTRLRERRGSHIADNMMRMMSAMPRAQTHVERLPLRSPGNIKLVNVAEIDWIEGAGVYVNLHVAGKAWLYRSSLNRLEEQLDPQRFVRIHRSAIVNIDSVIRLEALSHGEFTVILKGGGKARASRSYRSTLEKLLGQAL